MTRPWSLTFSCVMSLRFQDTIVLPFFSFHSILLSFFFPSRAIADAVSSYSFGSLFPYLNWLRWSGLGPRAKTPPAGVAMWVFLGATPPREFLLACGDSLILYGVKLSRLTVSRSRNKRHKKGVTFERKEGKHHHHLTRHFGRGWRCSLSSKNKNSS